MQRVEKGKRLKQRGADFMKAKDFRRACWVYRSVQDMMGYVDDWPEDTLRRHTKQQLARARSSEKDQAKKSQSLMRGMISEAGNLDYPVGYTTAEGDRERQRDAMLDKVDQIKAQMPLTL
eukprot:s462_g15.t1